MRDVVAIQRPQPVGVFMNGPHSVAIDALFFFSSRRRHTRCSRDWSSDVCSSDLLWMVGSASGIRRRYRELSPVLDERGRRRFAATEARAYGLSVVSRITGMARSTIARGVEDRKSVV